MFCHNKDFNKLNLYLFTNHRCGVREGVQGYSDSFMKLLQKESYFVCNMIPCVCVFAFVVTQNSCCTSRTQSVSHTGNLGGIMGSIGEYEKGLFYVFEVQHTHGKLSYHMFNELPQA